MCTPMRLAVHTAMARHSRGGEVSTHHTAPRDRCVYSASSLSPSVSMLSPSELYQQPRGALALGAVSTIPIPWSGSCRRSRSDYLDCLFLTFWPSPFSFYLLPGGS